MHFFKSLISILPNKYHYLLPQINDDFLIAFKENVLGFKDSYTFLLNAKLEPIYKNKKLPHFFILRGLNIWNSKENKFYRIELDILSGYLGGFNIASIEFSNFDFTKFDISEINEKHFENKDLNKLLINFDENEKAIISKYLDTTYSIKLSDGIFYYIDSIGNGDVIVLDKTGTVYLLIHDPANKIKIFSKEEFFEKLENKTLIMEATKIYTAL
ncbi:hypothetical protein FLACHUCJ7_04488 [Flavobacterium chungangense]|uniref:Uncharacterized protein n=1 Tax=Flavobacterium chungangense TaxID=554283 RepID=A0A6V6ZDI1_9FLAO|nr:hypothetical protein FLACHUCJ7_04488 [Flavobacterium chungangense]